MALTMPRERRAPVRGRAGRSFTRPLTLVAFLGAIVFMGRSAGEGGGAAGEGVPLPSKTLYWDPPTSFTDRSPLDPASDLKGYEVYVKTGRRFSENDEPVAFLPAVDEGTGELVNSFPLSDLDLSWDVLYYVSIRAVGTDDVTSHFSCTAAFAFSEVTETRFIRGDCVVDGRLSLDDVIAVLFRIFTSGPGRLEVECEDACDWNDDGRLGLADALHGLLYLFTPASAPSMPAPYPDWGVDPTEDLLGCGSYDPGSCP